MSNDPVFRSAITETPSQEGEAAKMPLEPGVSSVDHPTRPQEGWETNTKEYVTELFGMQEIAGEFPYKMQIGALDKYIKSEIESRGWSQDNEHYTKILHELVGETGTEDTEVFTKMKRLYEYVQVVTKLNALKKKKEDFLKSFQD